MFRISTLPCLLAGIVAVVSLQAQTSIRYRLDLSDISRHEIHIRAEFPALPRQTLVLRMPRSSPGRYAVHEFAKNVYEVEAFDRDGNALAITRTTPHQWEVGNHEGFVQVHYTLFGDRADGTYTGIDTRKVHMNMPATFLYGRNLEKRPVELEIDLSAHPGWTVATQLEPMGAHVFRAPDYYYFFDSPTIVGELDRRSWTVSDGNGSYTIEVAMDHDGTDEELDHYAEWVKEVVATEMEVFGEYPAFDHGRYTFLCAYNPEASGDGMEHRNSTICSSTGNLGESADQLIGTIAHEFFHAWNVERLRPQSLEPFDFDEANMSGELWFAEGFTSYYTPLVLRRAGIRSEEDYLNSIRGTIAYVEGSPGHLYRSPIEMSYQAPFVDAASFNDPTNYQNTFISYYAYGAYLGLALDLSLRSRFTGVSLDDVMARLWQEYGATEVPYAIPDLERALAEVCGDPAFARQFFADHIYQGKLPDMKSLLATMGVDMVYQHPNRAGFPRLQASFREEGALLESDPIRLNPLYQAGLIAGDIITRIGDAEIDSEEAWNEALERLNVGQDYPVFFIRNGETQQSSFTAKQDPAFSLELGNNAMERERHSRRKAWLELD